MAVARTEAAAARPLRRLLPGVEVLAGPDAATELTAAGDVDIVLNGITGSVGLGPTLAALARRGHGWRWPTRSRWSRAARW